MDGTDDSEIGMCVQCTDKPPDGIREEPAILVQQIDRVHIPDSLETQIVRAAESQIAGRSHNPDFRMVFPEPSDGIVPRGAIDNDR